MTIVAGTSGATVVGYPMCFTLVNKAAQNDMVTIFDAKGVIPFMVMNLANAASLSSGTQDWWEYAVIRDNGGHVAATKTVVYDGGVIGERTTGDYYLYAPASGEILYVSVDSGSAAVSGNLTVRRGCLGTTAADIANDDYLCVMNVIKLKGAMTGKTLIGYYKMPEDAKANLL